MRSAYALLLLSLLVAPFAGSTRAEEPRVEADAALEVAPEDDLLADLLAEAEAASQDRDPLEGMNRPVFSMNRVLDRWIFRPIARGYHWLVPRLGRRAVQNIFANLNEPVVFVNDILQLEPKRAGTAGARFLINTTVGVAGIFDAAERIGLEQHHADFGQTLGRAGIGSGPYLVLPVMGPSTIRDAVGTIVDGVFRPDTWLLSPGGRVLLTAGQGVSFREEMLDELDELERASIDFYAAIRHLYLTTREEMIRNP